MPHTAEITDDGFRIEERLRWLLWHKAGLARETAANDAMIARDLRQLADKRGVAFIRLEQAQQELR